MGRATGGSPPVPGDDSTTRLETLRNHVQELRELGPGGTAFRIVWELQTRSGLLATLDRVRRAERPAKASPAYLGRLPFAAPQAVRAATSHLISDQAKERLTSLAHDASQGRILAFGKWTADYGNPPDWHRSPVSRHVWSSDHWTRALRSGPPGEDIKLVWEIGRFPHAYHLARASTFDPAHAARHASTLQAQVASFLDDNPVATGVHWASGQEIAFRLIAWLFAAHGLLRDEPFATVRDNVATAALQGAEHIRRHIQYASKAVHNNHVLSEALALYTVGGVFCENPRATAFKRLGRSLLDEHVGRQFYPDGGYIQQSHNYHRLALQVLLTASAMARGFGEEPSACWLEALDRSLAFLAAQQNPEDGRLPNYGANDGALPLVLSTCDFSDFRPTLQAVSLLCRGARLYSPGPWDEESCWLLGPEALDAPERPIPAGSASFPVSGFHVQRSKTDNSCFSVLRCGTVLDRFSQIDMLHLDLWWRGQNVLVDGGSYLYNGKKKWHNHFMRTDSHNTVAVDGRDQMLHFRPFKCLYRTQAKLLELYDTADGSVRAGEHQGYKRHPGQVVHRRAVLQVKDDCWVVVDTLLGNGQHEARLHWLAGDFPVESPGAGRLTLRTPAGPFTIATFDENGLPLEGDVVRGQDDPPRGWLARYYGEKVPVPSLVVGRRGRLPMVFVTVLTGDASTVVLERDRWRIEAKYQIITFGVRQGLFTDLHVESVGRPSLGAA